jgi:hypothetical protein
MQLAERVEIRDPALKKCPSAAKAAVDIAASSAWLKPCPFKALHVSASCMAVALLCVLALWPVTLAAQSEPALGLPAQAEQLFTLANQARAAQGAGPLKWDAALAAAALAHCQRMAREGEIAHRYGDEPSLTDRAGQAGAHFSLIEENVAVGSNIEHIHQGWMNSPGHRANLLNPQVNRVGMAVVRAEGVFFAVADYARSAAVLTPAQVEAAVAALIRPSGVTIMKDPSAARAACVLDHGLPRSFSGPQPEFVMRWQNPDLFELPPDLANKLASGDFKLADIGSCPAQNVEGDFTVYRVAVLLYTSGSAWPKPYY